MINEDDQFFISRHIQRCIQTLLREVPDVAADLAAAIASGDGYSSRISFDPKVSMGERERPLAWNVSAQDAADALGNELSTWARHVCESRALDYDGSTSVAGLAHWLDRNIISLALTEGCEGAHDSIQHALRAARRSTGMPSPKAYAGNLAAARETELNAMAIERMRCELGDEYSGLTARRIKTLRNKTTLEPVRVVASVDGDLAVYRLGDVLDAHLAYPARQRKQEVA